MSVSGNERSPTRSSSVSKSIVPTGEGVPVRRLTLPLRSAQQPSDPRQQNRQLGRLRQVVVGAGGKPVEDVFGTPARREHEHRHELLGGAQLGHDREAVLARQHDVEHDEVELAVVTAEQPLESGLAGVDDLDGKAFRFEVEPQPLGQVQFVLDDEHALRRRAHAAVALGRRSVNVLPRPGPLLSANARPPCFLATDRTMKRPSPLPFARIATLAGMR